ncbi:LacI family DNA-binding transcriptional regulator [Limosilactobacillus sp. RRLNB_1_1]|uniref:LacI family DNA-binding transcriptional regulator n=1 Tax=Limosilactobacillus albertensis TaxID=2759752 RepID=A0A7W3Y918_9LACO|nr:LacI family DNA-binding transcriptional regulator [Limosilactobacillus albertensis]MBB1070226.1 LacI family DNA-binding transcriptional regulator [Limosilactobacillus albertensis]MCD7119175.1 LacI family DNA-binding transcriptional regulator [Limosilactobacillus albertensis]MCD7129383.1 LacI family DNA-binding transcriptional regulator [Limosilactobacillus albertensis]
MATIKEIAEKSGYSPATVSRLLNNDQNLSISPTTRNKIMTVANELGYWKSHRKQSQQPIRPNIALLYRVSGKEQLQDEYFAFLRNEIIKEVDKAGLQVEIFGHIADLTKAADSFQGFIGVGADRVTQDQLIALHHKLPHGVFVDINPMPKLFDSVQPNLELTVQDALSRLVKAGYERVGFIGGKGLKLNNIQQADAREIAFREFASMQGIKEAPLYVDGPFNVENGYRLGRMVIDQSKNNLPEAFIIASDTLSVGVLQAFNEAGILVPRDTAVISINNSEVAKYVSPPLTSYNINQQTLSRMAIELLQDLITHPDRPHVHLKVNTDIVYRKSFLNNNG